MLHWSQHEIIIDYFMLIPDINVLYMIHHVNILDKFDYTFI